jgi:hypothetical protein
MVTLRQITEELPLINRIHLRRSRLRAMLRTDAPQIPSAEDLKETIAYVQKNTVQGKDGRKCVDGRYPPDQAAGMIARAGGDCGYVMALMAINKKKKLGMTPEQCLNAVYKVIRTKLHGAFCIHTDHHVDPLHESANQKMHQTLIGCGHLSKAATQGRLREKYDVHNEDVKKIIAYARNLADIGEGVEIVNLAGEHAERGVLLVDDATYTVNAWDQEMHKMYFIYDKKRDEEFMKKLVKEINLPGVTFADMKKESDIQLQATLHNLAKGLPLYNVSYKEKTPNVSYVTTIQ